MPAKRLPKVGTSSPHQAPQQNEPPGQAAEY
jgi:hypothetical protein